MNESKKKDSKLFILDKIREKRVIKQANLIKEIKINERKLSGTSKNTILKNLNKLIATKEISIIPSEAFKKYRIRDWVGATYYCLGEESDFNKYVTNVISALYDDKDVVFENAVNELINFKEIALESNELIDISDNLNKQIEKEVDENYQTDDGKIEKRIIKTTEITSPFFCNKIVKLLRIQIENNTVNLKDEELDHFINNLITCFFNQGNLLDERWDLQFMSMIAKKIEKDIEYKSELRQNIIYIIFKLKPGYIIENLFIEDINNNLSILNNFTSLPTHKSFNNIEYDFKLENNVWDNLKIINKLVEIIYLNYASNNLQHIFNSDKAKHTLFKYITDRLSPNNYRNIIIFINRIRLENGDSDDIK